MHIHFSNEDEKVRYLRTLADVQYQRIASGRVKKEEALKNIDQLKEVALQLFPDKGNVFDLVYRTRLLRLIDTVYKRNA